MNSDAVNLNVTIAGIQMQNPMMNASGCFAIEAASRISGLDPSCYGAMLSKGTTLELRSGNHQPRICEHPEGGMVNSIGLENLGIDHTLKVIVPKMAKYGVPVILNISGFTIEEFKVMAAKANQVVDVTALEVNISCPNVHGGKIPFGCDPQIAAEVTKAVRSVTDLPVIVKLTPNVSEKLIGEIAQAVEQAGADAISLINTVKVENIGGIPVGGWSGPPIKPIAMRMISLVRQAVKIPIIGMGGVTTVEDVVDFIKLGCSGVAVGTASFANPLIIMELIDGLKKYCLEHGISDISQLNGKK